ncbi:hypothetical protein Aglo02_32080 [Actinokineospora globicatena]|nr:hypothetical protein Aglo02_32080 [Actinokineospora globicatena]
MTTTVAGSGGTFSAPAPSTTTTGLHSANARKACDTNRPPRNGANALGIPKRDPPPAASSNPATRVPPETAMAAA